MRSSGARAVESLRGALAFLTPLGEARRPEPAALSWFPAVGLALGAVLGSIWWLAAQVWPAPVAAALVVFADLTLTGLLHLDGLIDCGDGLLAPLTRERRLAIMAEPQVGAFGVAVGTAVLIGRFAALAVLAPAPLLLAGLWGLSRTVMAAIVGTQPYARDAGGLAAAFGATAAPVGRIARRSIVVGALAASGALLCWRLEVGPAVVVVAIGAAAATVALARRRLGGYTGDVVGAAGLLAETAGLLAASARW